MSKPDGSAPPTELVPPWHYRVGKWLGRRGVRGSGLLIRAPHRLGWLQRVVRFKVRGNYTVDVPLYRVANQWDAQQVTDYEVAFLDTVAAQIRHWKEPVTLVDCGADIGLFSVALVARCEQISSVIAFEPDRQAHEILARNLSRLPIATECHRLGIGARCGRAQLVVPGKSEHAQFLAPDAAGEIEIVTLDGMLAGRPDICRGHFVLKVDVEGRELAVLHGAELLLRSVPAFLVGFEAHRAVAARTGIDPIECARFLASLRNCRFVVSELPERNLSLDRPFFEQVEGGGNVFNVVALTDEPEP